jgi:thiamine-phosphate pyrophosphorylase
MKALFVTDRDAVGDARLARILNCLSNTPGLAVTLRDASGDDARLLGHARDAAARLSPEVPLYVHRRFDVALAAEAAGVHLPASGLPARAVRAATPRGFRIGVSTHSAAEAEQAISDGADFVVIGPVFDTPSKRAYGPPIGPGALQALPLRESHGRDVFAIGGVNEENLAALEPYRDRISGIAAIRLFQDSPDPRALAERIASR